MPTPPRLVEVHIVNRPPADLEEVDLSGYQALVGLDVVGGLWTANLQPYEHRADPSDPSTVRFRLGAWEPLVSEPEVARVEATPSPASWLTKVRAAGLDI